MNLYSLRSTLVFGGVALPRLGSAVMMTKSCERVHLTAHKNNGACEDHMGHWGTPVTPLPFTGGLFPLYCPLLAHNVNSVSNQKN